MEWYVLKFDFVVHASSFSNVFSFVSSGYRDALYNIRVDGMIVEVQLHLAAILSLKEESHIYYEFFRTFFSGNVVAVKSRMDTLEKLVDTSMDVDMETRLISLLDDTDVEMIETIANLVETLGDCHLRAECYRRLLDL